MEDEASRLLQTLKRQTVPMACYSCRRRKVKCDGRLPCSYCARRSLECSYESTLPNETLQQAKKRRYHEIERRIEGLEQLHDILARGNEARAVEVLRRMRRGDNIELLLDYARAGAGVDGSSLEQSQHSRRLFLKSLVESTASLEETTNAARTVVTIDRLYLPSVEAYQTLQHSVLQLDHLDGFLSETNSQRATGASAQQRAEDKSSGPLYWVPAQPWLVAVSDEETSHLLSMFLAYTNVCWRFVEVQPFLQALRSKDLGSQYCSPFLVNAMMALAYLYADIANSGDDDPEGAPHQNIRFHEEALRLWTLAGPEPSITNIQGLSILAVEHILQGKDQQGLDLLSAACELNNTLHLPVRLAEWSREDLVYYRARSCTWWMVVHLNLTCRMGLMIAGDAVDWNRAPEMADVLLEDLQYWIGYPFLDEPIPLQANFLFQQRCLFTRLLQQATTILTAHSLEADALSELVSASQALSAQLQEWYDAIPQEVFPITRAPPNIYDLHAQYHCVQAALYERSHMHLCALMQETEHDTEELAGSERARLRIHLRATALQHCYEGATVLRAFRKAHGLKCVSFVLLNHSVVGAFVCLNDMHTPPEGSTPRTGKGLESDQRTISALEEFFRIILATSGRWILSRGLAKMIYYTASKELRIELPASISDITEIMNNSSWHSSDLLQLSATFRPNWSMPYVRKDDDLGNYRMGDMLNDLMESSGHRDGAVEPRPSSSRVMAYDPVHD
ncbi:hypothetical protein CKM354_000000400 [Cercospora kikuchii]|uniref:Zn(2)-C6 fungal-type domain-containing protein n=1 Tax=Cercospora kikuchii TaxID=84275 RepID=A0A9P3C560_9PEZI|nr:uncharacterized protein CKM354_000000400 [Cercospora kikuchii]GIZ36533.1 hypothetical protein CKM354_000000400 [Cercospora kikuchii]